MPALSNDYKDLFSLMIKNWREDWGEGNFPFYYVQIAPYLYGMNTKSQMIRGGAAPDAC